MATCHKCGAPNAIYRRTTFTGYSKGSRLGSGSYGASTRTYYGLKSVCQDCAKSIDRWNTIKTIFWIAVVALAIFYFFSWLKPDTSSPGAQAYHYSGQTARITATKSPNLRDRPSSAGAILLTVPYNETVGIIDKTSNSEIISDQTATGIKWIIRERLGGCGVGIFNHNKSISNRAFGGLRESASVSLKYCKMCYIRILVFTVI